VAFFSHRQGSPRYWPRGPPGHGAVQSHGRGRGHIHELAPVPVLAGAHLRQQGGEGHHPGERGECDAAPLFDGTHLFLAGVVTTIKGVSYDGSVRKVNPATAGLIWQAGLPGKIMGTPGMDGAG
jgi:hypothetical protein